MNPSVKASMEQAAVANASGERTERMPFVMLIIALAVAMFISMVAVIYYRWVTVSAPSSAMHIIGDETLDGVVVTIDGVGMSSPEVITLGADNAFQSPLYLHPGSYEVRAVLAEKVIFHKRIDVYPNRGIRLDLPAQLKEQQAPEEL